MDIKKTSEIKPDKIKALIYGASSVGKTTLASTLPPSTIVVSLESGLLSLKDFNIDYVEIKTLVDLREVLTELTTSEYENIYIDSLSSISELFLVNSKKEFPEAKSTMQMYGHLLESSIGFVRYVRDLPKNVFLTALEKTTADEIGRRFSVPDLAGSASTKVAAYFDMVLNMRFIEVDGDKRRVLITESTETAIAKDRSGKLSRYESPNLTAIIDKVFNK